MVQEKNNTYLAITAKIMVSLLITTAIFITALIAILHSSIGWDFLQRSIERSTDLKIQSTDFKYDFRKPFSFYFKDLAVTYAQQKTHRIEELNLTLSPFSSPCCFFFSFFLFRFSIVFCTT